MVRKVVIKAGYTIVKSNMDAEKKEESANMYYARDILIVIKRTLN